MMNFTGDGVEEDDEGEKRLRMAAAEGDPVAMKIVEMMDD